MINSPACSGPSSRAEQSAPGRCADDSQPRRICLSHLRSSMGPATFCGTAPTEVARFLRPADESETNELTGDPGDNPFSVRRAQRKTVSCVYRRPSGVVAHPAKDVAPDSRSLTSIRLLGRYPG